MSTHTNFISQFYEGSVEEAINALTVSNYDFGRAAFDLCVAFDLNILKVDVASAGEKSVRVMFVTPSGLYAGALERWHITGKLSYVFTSPVIRKEKAGKTSINSRHAEKITGLIMAMKRSYETPSTETITKKITSGVRYAYGTVESANTKTAHLSVTINETLAMLQFVFDGDQATFDEYKVSLKGKYDEYLKELEKIKEGRAYIDNYKRPCHLVGIVRDRTSTQPHYLISEVIRENSVIKLLKPLVRHKTLVDTHLAVDAAMIRTYMSGKPTGHNPDNELGLSYRDDYLSDIDIAMGYDGPAWYHWVLIPKTDMNSHAV